MPNYQSAENAGAFERIKTAVSDEARWIMSTRNSMGKL